MYIPKVFEQADSASVFKLVKDFPFATLIASSNDGLEAEHLPMYMDDGVLQGHVAKGNPFWQRIAEGSDVMAIFQGANSYISPSYYPSKQRDGKVVPTWNYLVVHVKGKIKYKHEANWKLSMLTRLTDLHETKKSMPWQVSDAPQDYLVNMLSALVGIEIHIESMAGKWKVSQNQSAENKQGVVDGLAQEETPSASLMSSIIGAS
jgi:transcriptional regulator